MTDNIVVMDKGRVIAEGTPLHLKQQAGNASLVVKMVSQVDDLEAAAALLRKTGAEVFVDIGARQLTAAADGLADMTRVAGWLRDSEIDVDGHIGLVAAEPRRRVPVAHRTPLYPKLLTEEESA